MTVNEFVCLFPRGTRIKVHMIFAEKSLYNPNVDYGVWGSGDYHGITRYPVGESQVRNALVNRFKAKSDDYDVFLWCFEPNFIEKCKGLRK